MKEPSRELIIKWMNAELSGNDLDSVESWADENPDLAGKIISELEEPITSFATIPSVVEPPYADFLNSKIKQGIEAEESFTEAVPVKEVKPSLWSRLQLLFVPVALAAMVASFSHFSLYS